VMIMVMFFWVYASRGQVGRSQRFREAYCLHFQGCSDDVPSSVTTDGQSVSWCRASFWAHNQISHSDSWHLESFFSSGAFSDERTGPSFVRSLCHMYMVFISLYTIYTDVLFCMHGQYEKYISGLC
jgi:hypothetical protein